MPIQHPVRPPEASCSEILLFPKEQDNSPMPLLALRFSNISKHLYEQIKSLGIFAAFLLKLNYLPRS